jgi:integrase/recombinase XerC
MTATELPMAIENKESPPPWAHEVVELLLSDNRSAETQRAYRRDLEEFFRLHERELSPTSVQWLCSLDVGTLTLLLNLYKRELRRRQLSEATVNRRLAAVRALLRFARRLGASCPDPAKLVTGEKVRAYRDTRGPGIEAVVRILTSIDRTTLPGKRDFALLRLMAENALRRGEIERTNVGDFEPERQRLWILGKGRGSQQESITLSPATVDAIEQYCLARRTSGEELSDASPLLLSHGRGRKSADNRLTGRGILFIVDSYGRTVLGKPLHPHALRHTSITVALDATGGDIRSVQRLSRHRDVRTLTLYDDNRQDLQGNVTNLISKRLNDETQVTGELPGDTDSR